MTDENKPETLEPPTEFRGILRYLGPGLIIAAAIVGSGELIATTKTGAEAGIDLLWLIILGCVIKVFVQVELTRCTISEGQTPLKTLNRVPGPGAPSLRGTRSNWVLWLWLIMMITTIGQLGGIVGGVGQACALTLPITGDYADVIGKPAIKEFQRYVELSEEAENGWPSLKGVSQAEQDRAKRGFRKLQERIEASGEDGQMALTLLAMETDEAGSSLKQLLEPETNDDKYWAGIIAIITSVFLFVGRYSLIQNLSMALVVTFTLVTIGNVIGLQGTEYALSGGDIMRGLSFRIPEATAGAQPVVTALAAFGIIGVGATELISYPYWCFERGYARYTGPRDESDGWKNRALGWCRVLRYDAFISMIIYTVATIAFFYIGVTVLYSNGQNPESTRMVSTLATAYVPVFGSFAKWLFLGGAIAVLYSTFLVANAANARMISDGMRVVGLIPDAEANYSRMVTVFSVVLPLTCAAIYWAGWDPVGLILIAGLTQFFMLPVLGFSSIYFRYKVTDQRLRPSRSWDVLLIVSSMALLIVGAYGVFGKAGPKLVDYVSSVVSG